LGQTIFGAVFAAFSGFFLDWRACAREVGRMVGKPAWWDRGEAIAKGGKKI
jgi:hypothetical protein